MTPPNQYFVRCEAGEPGSQRVGFEHFKFSHPDCLSEMMDEGVFDDLDSSLSERLSSALQEVEDLERRINDLEEELQEARK